MRKTFDRAVDASMALLFLIGFFLMLVAVSSARQRVRLPVQAGDMLYMGLPLLQEVDGDLMGDPGYFWGSIGSSRWLALNNTSVAAAESTFSLNDGPIPTTISLAHKVHEFDTDAAQRWYDPRIPVAEAVAQIPRIAGARHVSEEEVATLIDRYTEVSLFGLVGEARVNTMDLNSSLDADYPAAVRAEVK